MTVIVQKYGGQTLESPEKILKIAGRINDLAKDHQVIVVVSAMGKTTDDLVKLSRQISKNPHQREFDMLLSAGERISMALLTMALHDLKCDAISFTGSQAGILTEGSHGDSNIKEIKPIRVEESLKQGKVVVIAGFQGVDPTSKEVQTLGRGGSDTTAVHLASHFNAERCEILKEFKGVYTADPRIIKNASVVTEMTFDNLCHLSHWGGNFIHVKAANFAREKKVPLLLACSEESPEKTRVVESDRNEELRAVAIQTLPIAPNKIIEDNSDDLTYFRKLNDSFCTFETRHGRDIDSNCAVTIVFSKPPTEETKNTLLCQLQTNDIGVVESFIGTENNLTFVLNPDQKIKTVELLHHRIFINKAKL